MGRGKWKTKADALGEIILKLSLDDNYESLYIDDYQRKGAKKIGRGYKTRKCQ